MSSAIRLIRIGQQVGKHYWLDLLNYLREELNMAIQDQSEKISSMVSFAEWFDRYQKAHHLGAPSNYREIVDHPMVEVDVIDELKKSMQQLEDMSLRMRFMLREIQGMVR